MERFRFSFLIGVIVFVLSLNPMYGEASTFFVCNGGDDSLDGKSQATAWETIGKINRHARAQGFRDGDVICFRRGDLFDDQTLGFDGNFVIWNVNGITFRDYGNGSKPILDGNRIYPIALKGSGQAGNLRNVTLLNLDISGTDLDPWTQGSNEKHQVLLERIDGITIDGIEGDGHSGAKPTFREGIFKIKLCSGRITIQNCKLRNWYPAGGLNLTDGKDTIAIHIRQGYDAVSGTSGQQPEAVEIRNNLVERVQSDAVQIAGVIPSAEIGIFENHFVDFGEEGVDVKSSKHVRIYRNRFERSSGFDGPDVTPAHIVIHGSPDFRSGDGSNAIEAADVHIFDNHFSGIGPSWGMRGIMTTSKDGVGSNDVRIYRNRISDCGRRAILLHKTMNAQIYENLIVAGDQITFEKPDMILLMGGLSGNIDIHHNTLFVNSSGAEVKYGINIPETEAFIRIHENIAVIHRDSDAAFPIYWSGGGTKPEIFRNCWYNVAHSNRVFWAGAIFEKNQTESWRAKAGPGDLFDDPKFIDPENDDFSLKDNSPCRGVDGQILGATRLPDPSIIGVNFSSSTGSKGTELVAPRGLRFHLN